MKVKSSFKGCPLKYKCNEKWEDLQRTPVPEVRHCRVCEKPVHWISSDMELFDACQEGKCVAFYDFSTDESSLPVMGTTFVSAEEYEKLIEEMTNPRGTIAHR
ncbi:hypothetical protein GCM10017044_03180 [Kordiimonas sediminis]|uniref:Uncharacterized protein n=1 Tax=Kordiimonas sediminis TaxID=1735581 RepID=A0A919AKA0_9PROT|nr:hypothetical protein [Kordiimonas sediminis]GHF12582.1 hypothetical protein GCM10017044_03180 [Kordiimonas sediminis]